jgi:uncharacterized protein YjbJ (UPF0337 family)
MDENRISGTVRNAGGKAEEAVGRVTGDLKKQVQGKLDQAAGAAQEFYGQTADAARDTAVTLDKWLRTTIETQPYTVTLVAFGIGWLLGRIRFSNGPGIIDPEVVREPQSDWRSERALMAFRDVRSGVSLRLPRPLVPLRRGRPPGPDHRSDAWWAVSGGGQRYRKAVEGALSPSAC